MILIDSPVGYPGRAIRNPFALKIMDGTATKAKICDSCLKSCTRSFCIIRALTRAQQGDVDTGLIFTGERMGEIKDILSVKEIFSRLLGEIETING